MHVITAEQLRRAVPKCTNPVGWVEPLNNAMLVYGIAFDLDYMVEFLAQCAHETADFNRLEESLNYSAERMAAVWPRRFAVDPTAKVKEPNALARQLAHKPHLLADTVYGGRMGNDADGDGWRYRGRGMPMITGKDNYRRVAKMLNDPIIVLCPDRLCTKVTAAMAGAAWWSSNPKLNALADDQPGDDDHADFVSITKIVNGGTEGLADRSRLRDAFKKALLG
jgi:putative chitinase